MNLILPPMMLSKIRPFAFGLCAFLLHSPIAHATPVFETVHGFYSSSHSPNSKLIQGSDGDFYGTSVDGNNGGGTVFKVTTAGVLKTLVNFDYSTSGNEPNGGLVQGSDGNFYGTTIRGGSSGAGTVFKTTATGVLTTLVNFDNSTHGGYPEAGLVQGNDGNFYGTTALGSSSHGTVFKMTPGGDVTTLVNFDKSTNGEQPSGLVKGSDGDFYGTTVRGGSSNNGTVFKITTSGVLTTLLNFSGTNGGGPSAGLIQGSDGDFYGTTYQGGTTNNGTVFKMTAGGVLTTLVNFDYNTTGSNPAAELAEDNDGNFYGTISRTGLYGYGTVFKLTADGVLTTPINFDGTNGKHPQAGLVKGNDGNLYGTTFDGGHGDEGTVFKMTTDGDLTTLVSFEVIGSNPNAGLIQGSDGSFYGTTADGGSHNNGTVFKLTEDGTLHTLVNFDSTTNGGSPKASLVQGSDGNFYGTTSNGGSNGIYGGSNGTVFKMTAAGVLTTLVNFDYSTSGASPLAGLVQGSDGNFYGTTSVGGTNGGAGTVFKITAAGTFTTLAIFNNSINGGSPQGVPVQGSDGDFYGTTNYGGSHSGGTVFKMTTTGDFTTLVNFDYDTNGRNPVAGLVQGSDGDFYGTTPYGGSESYGTVFKVTAAGVLTTLVNFNYSTTGTNCQASLLQSSDGNFYGTTNQGGISNIGTVFKMTTAGVLTTLVNFNGNNGSYPLAGLVRARDGNFYSTTTGSNSPAGGLIYRLRVGPSVTTQAASSMTSSNAQLNAMVNPGGYDTPVTFQYGTSPTLATYATVSAGILSAGTAPISVQANLTGLSANTVYYYRIVASNAENTVPQTGAIHTFTTTAVSPAMALFNNAAAGAGLNGPDALPTAIPFGDGVTNLVKYAFNMKLGQADASVLGVAGNSGLPFVARDTNGAQPILRIQFLRRIGSGLSYTPLRSTTLTGFSPMTGTQTITPIDAQWEKVSVEEISTAPSNFAKVQVEVP